MVAGRLLCDTYLAARDLVHEVDYTLSTLARNLLKQERAELSPTDIPGERRANAFIRLVRREPWVGAVALSSTCTASCVQ